MSCPGRSGRAVALSLALACGAHGSTPDESIYGLKVALTDQTGASFELGSLRGQPVLIAMWYASCATVCPLLVADLKALERTLPPASRERLRVVLVSFDPERDTPARLKEVAAAYQLDPRRYTLVRAPAGDVRTLASVLGVKYAKQENGTYAHTAVVGLLDKQGVLTARAEGSGAEIKVLAEPLRKEADRPAVSPAVRSRR